MIRGRYVDQSRPAALREKVYCRVWQHVGEKTSLRFLFGGSSVLKSLLRHDQAGMGPVERSEGKCRWDLEGRRPSGWIRVREAYVRRMGAQAARSQFPPTHAKWAWRVPFTEQWLPQAQFVWQSQSSSVRFFGDAGSGDCDGDGRGRVTPERAGAGLAEVGLARRTFRGIATRVDRAH